MDALRAKLLAALPFTLTASQQAALADIEADLAAPERMLRLLQGDVGSGKTVVALLAAANVIEAGGQAAMMAPTELLVRQHARTIAPLADAAGIRIAVLTGREKGREREAILAGLADGSIDLLIGTHALFQAGVAFHDLALVVVDEQHRFGVHQRLALTAKGGATDVLVMTATPDPAHAGAHLLRRHGRLAPDREAGRPPADRHARRRRSTGSTRWSSASARPSPTAPRPTGSARWSRSPRCSTMSPPPRSATPR